MPQYRIDSLQYRQSLSSAIRGLQFRDPHPTAPGLHTRRQ